MASLFFRLKVGFRIYSGFALVLSLLGIVGIYGIYELSDTKDRFTEYGETSSNAGRVLTIGMNFAEMRRSVLLYISDGEAASAEYAEKKLGLILADLGRVLEITEDPASRARLERMIQIAKEYGVSLDKVKQARIKREALFTQKLKPTSSKLANNLSTLMSRAMTDGELELAGLAGGAQEQFMYAELSAIGFLAAPDPALVESVTNRIGAFRPAAERLSAWLENFQER
jgi:methyl-accepting chemotaxis protein